MFFASTYPINVSQTIPFTVEEGPFLPPSVSIASPENKTYESLDVPLNFTVDKSVSQITYSLDGQKNVTVARNITLTSLSQGEHNITVYATNSAGSIGASETINFTVAKEPESFPTATAVAASGVSAAVISVGLLVYLKKCKH